MCHRDYPGVLKDVVRPTLESTLQIELFWDGDELFYNILIMSNLLFLFRLRHLLFFLKSRFFLLRFFRQFAPLVF